MIGLFPFLPAFVDLAGRRVVLLSGDADTAARARTFLDAGAGLDIYAVEPSDEARALCPPARLFTRPWKPSDLDGAALVVAVRGERTAAARRAARARRALFCVLDAAQASDLALGDFTRRGALAIGVSTAGLPPVLAQTVRRRIEDVLPDWLEGFLAASGRLRPAVEVRIADPAWRRRFWTEAAEAALDAAQADWDRWLIQRLETADPEPTARLDIVRVPADPQLLTLADARALARADLAVLAPGLPHAVEALLRAGTECCALEAPDHGATIRLARRDGRRVVVVASARDQALVENWLAAWNGQTAAA
jgi:uroporphyrin-III C-methyltransferase/precorrin-2 dehydrogenase/sirohydrochlorin ferrochelatase